ncbi:putative polypeptide N-acetylgalactosaminyltransferase 9, partial [Oratosquilla oratoria]|uniref:putative polypeptide N-acetylgalactosaminyltransferase 9 n=1 Tax=Oratosquilla oratoria TaxID=337810 RepID=UPI003F75CC88
MAYLKTLIIRRRGVLLKLTVIIPALWLVLNVLTLSDKQDKESLDGAAPVRPRDDAHVNIPPERQEQIRLPPREPSGSAKSKLREKLAEKKIAKKKEEEEVVKKKVEDEIIEEPEEPHEVHHQQEVLLPPQELNGPGEMGKPVVLPKDLDPETKKLVDEGWQKNAFNQYVSDKISLHRSLPDPRDDWCKVPGRYLKDLPSTSVIVCFHNEAWSVLLRTVHSVLDRSPDHLLKEIILVDDFSDMQHLMKQLDDYVAQYPKVKILRLPKREGLIRARLAGAKEATAPVLTFLDSHCECTQGWLTPLLHRIAQNSWNVVTPVIESIMDDSFEFRITKADSVAVGGFDWHLTFNWHAIPARERARHNHSAEPVYSPTMAGGLFSIDRDFFYRLGAYDPGFDIWGGENLELSFKIWMCGGTLEIVPCSHVGHIFRKRSPYKWRQGVNVLKRNSIRLARVWLDDYSKYYFQRIGYDLGDYGDVSDRIALRQQLGCKSFQWYLENVYPELFVPGDAVASGEVNNLGTGMCIDSPAKAENNHKPVGLWPCHKQGG